MQFWQLCWKFFVRTSIFFRCRKRNHFTILFRKVFSAKCLLGYVENAVSQPCDKMLALIIYFFCSKSEQMYEPFQQKFSSQMFPWRDKLQFWDTNSESFHSKSLKNRKYNETLSILLRARVESSFDNTRSLKNRRKILKGTLKKWKKTFFLLLGIIFHVILVLGEPHLTK